MKVFIVQQRNWALRVGVPLVEYIHKKNPEIIFSSLVYKTEVWNHFHESCHADMYDDLILGWKYDDNINDEKISAQLDAISIEDIEKELAVTSIWKDIVYIDRSLVYTPGKKWRYDFRKQVSDEKLIKLVKLNYLLVRDRIFGEDPPDVIFLPLFGSLFHNVLYHYAKQKGIKCWMINTVKLRNRFVLTSSKMYDLSDVLGQDVKLSESDINSAKQFIAEFRGNPLPPEHLLDINTRTILPLKSYLVELLKLPVRAFKQFLRNRSPLNPTVYRVPDNMTAFQRLKGGLVGIYYSLVSLKGVSYDSLPTKKFLLFPLHVVPEVSINLWGPEYSDQADVVRRIAISLPSSVVLVVKEHPVMISRRNPSFYKEILGIPNVKLIPPGVSALDVLNNDNCLGSVVISGTAGFESALLGKISFVLSKMYYRDLPNCFHVRPEEITKDKIEEAISISRNEVEKALINFVSTLFAVSFQSKYSSVWSRGQDENINPVFEQFYKKLQEVM